MIPRIKLYPMAVGAVAVFIFVSTSNMIMIDAFTTPSHSHSHVHVHQSTPSTITTSTAYTSTSRQSSLVNPDWDNSDFMNSLGGPTEELNEANDKYYKQAENRAAMNDWRYEQMQQQQQQQGTAPSTQQQQLQQQSVQDSGPSPDLLKKMGMPDGQVPSPPQQMQMQQPPPPQQQQPPPQQQFYDANGNPVSMPMVYDANGNLIPFNPQTQSPQQQQQQQQQQGTQFNTQQYAPQRNQPPQANPNAPVFQPNLPNALEPPLPPNTKQTGSPGRPQGYNSDAFTMSNTADVYFAQLKQDSKVRKMARLSGDIETSNQVFGDNSIQEIGDSWNSNPYTKEKNLQEARAQIEGIVRNQVSDSGSGSGNDNNSYGDGGNNNMGTGQISYKEKLAQMKAAKRSGGGVATTTTVTQSVTQQQQPKTEPPKVITPPPSSPPFKVEQQPLENVAFYNKPPKVEHPKVTAPHPVAKVQLQQQQTPTPPPLQASTSTFTPPKEQEDIDAEQIAQGGGYGLAAGTTNTYAIPGMDEMSPQEYRDKLQETVSARQAERRKQSLSANDGLIGNRSSSGYLDGLKRQSAVQPAAPAATAVVAPTAPREMPPRSESTPIQAQAATMISTTPMNDPLAGSVACVEAALRMYKDSSPDDREAMMIPLREALLAASSASNRYVAESELTAHRAAMDAGPAAFASTLSNDPPTMSFPEKYDITNPEEERIESAKPTMSNGATNEEKLQEVYNALKDAKGDEGKLGLKNLSGNEANALIDQIVTMRTVLLDELNNGS